MGGMLYLGIGFLLVITIIVISAYLTRNNPVDHKNKAIAVTIGILQAAHALLYITGLLAAIGEAHVYLSFTICVVLSLLCVVLSIWISLPRNKFKNTIKYLFVFIAVLQTLATIYIFLLPEAGIPALIP